ncbi:MAG: hypothetical protein KIT09_28310 [Bryobacteraceae bacterium]|nr:hypothetical protein [Bryobacteraceae bacterium]
MESWYKVATSRREVREGRSFNPDEFAIALEQVVADLRQILDDLGLTGKMEIQDS